MDKKLFALLLIAYVALLIGCSGSGVNLKVDDDYRTGTGSVQLSFDSATTSKLFEKETGIIIVKAKNTGAFTVPSGRIVVSSDDSILYFGSRDEYESNSAQANTKSLVKSGNRQFLGKSAISPTGDQLAFDFPVYAPALPQESQQRSVKVVAVACFPYQTFQSNTVCIDTDPYGLKATDKLKSACKAADVSMKTGGGPINVQTVQVRFASDADFEVKPTFYFTLSATSFGLSGTKFFAPGDEQSFCDSRIHSSADAHDLVYFKATLSDRALICNGNRVAGFNDVYAVKLYDSAARVTCETDGPITFNSEIIGNYLAPLTVNISYGVVTSSSQTIQVTAIR